MTNSAQWGRVGEKYSIVFSKQNILRIRRYKWHCQEIAQIVTKILQITTKLHILSLVFYLFTIGRITQIEHAKANYRQRAIKMMFLNLLFKRDHFSPALQTICHKHCANYLLKAFGIIIRPSVAGAVLQTPL